MPLEVVEVVVVDAVVVLCVVLEAEPVVDVLVDSSGWASPPPGEDPVWLFSEVVTCGVKE